MQLLFIAITITLLLVITYQDYTSRAVQWIFFPLLGLTGMLLAFLDLHSFPRVFANFARNLAFLALQLALLKVYFLVRHKKDHLLINKKIGWGDILFLVAVCFFFSPFNFIIFYTASLFFTVIIYLVTVSINKTARSSTIPLAGLQALFLMICICVSAYLKYSIMHDDWLLLKLVSL